MQTYKITQEESTRLNALKVLMCIFVMVIHAFSYSIEAKVTGDTAFLYQCTFVLSNIICDCAVPVFILISSVLLYAKPFDWRSNAVKKARSLLVPYFIFNSLWVVLVFAKHELGKRLGIAAGDIMNPAAFSLFDWLDAYLGLIDDYKPLLTTLWYIRDLFMLNLLAKPIQKLIDKFPMPVLVLTLAVWLLDVPTPFIQSYSLIFFVLGYCLVKYNIHLQDTDRLNTWLVTAAYAVLLLADILLHREVAFVNRLFILVSVVFFAQMSKYSLRAGGAVAFLAPAAFFLYLTHRFVYEVLQVLLPNTMRVYLISYPLKPVIALVSMTALYYLLKRFLPKLLAVLVGGRLTPR